MKKHSFVNYLLMAFCISVFVFLQSLGPNELLLNTFALNPKEVTTGTELPLTLLTSVFLHGNVFHIFSNMLFLWAFGEDVEKGLGHLKYMTLFLVCGIIAGVSQVIATPNLLVNVFGASGAVSGVLGAHLILFWKRKFEVEVFTLQLKIPVYLILIAWMFSQVASIYAFPSEQAGIAYLPHVVGFVAGAVMIKIEKALPHGRSCEEFKFND